MATRAEPATDALGKFIDREIEKYLRQLGLKDMGALDRESERFHGIEPVNLGDDVYEEVSRPIFFRISVLSLIQALDSDGREMIESADGWISEIREEIRQALKRPLTDVEVEKTRQQVKKACRVQRSVFKKGSAEVDMKIAAWRASKEFAEWISGEGESAAA